jgi:hypothetical protein
MHEKYDWTDNRVLRKWPPYIDAVTHFENIYQRVYTVMPRDAVPSLIYDPQWDNCLRQAVMQPKCSFRQTSAVQR